jgi:thymidylate kinase
MNYRAIIFFGPDGSGKTTQADILLQELTRKGIKCKRFWMRSLHTLAFLISKIAMNLLSLHNVYEFREKYAVRLRRLWYFIELISILPLVIRFYILLYRGYVVIADRFIIDWIVSLAYVMRDESFINSRYAKLVLKFIPRNSLLIFLDADYDVIIRRRVDTAESKEYIMFQKKYYTIFAKSLGAQIIDTSNKNILDVNGFLINIISN